MYHVPNYDRVADVLIEIEWRRRGQDACGKEESDDAVSDEDDVGVLPGVDRGAG